MPLSVFCKSALNTDRADFHPPETKEKKPVPNQTAKRSYSLQLLCILLVFAIYCAPALVTPCRAGDRISWEQLPCYLENQKIELKDLAVIDAPAGLNENSPSHNIIQVIANTLYEWNEYEFFTAPGETVRALSLKRPKKMRLSATEARVLLTASSCLLQKENLSPKIPTRTGTVAAAQLRRKTRFVGISSNLRRTEYIEDNRVRVGNKVTEYPYNTITYLSFLSEGEPYSATGFLASESCLLTAGHNVYWPLTDDYPWSEQMAITPGQNQARENTSVYMPYGSISSDDMYTNSDFPEAEDLLKQPNEYDYACLLLNQTFPGVNTFMPLEFNARPQTTVNIAGYPPEVQGETNSMDMWSGSGPVIGIRGENRQIIDFDIFISAGHSGGPIWYFDKFSNENRTIGIVTWSNVTYGSGVRLTDMNKKLILSWLTKETVYDYKYTYYIPYFAATESKWSGLALANHHNISNNIRVEYFTPDGIPAGSKFITLVHYGQTAFACDPQKVSYGWIRVSASAPLYGMMLIGNSTPSTMFDLDMQSSLNRKLILPHLADDGKDWKSIVVLCNPNATVAEITYTYYAPETGAETRATISIPAWGSMTDELGERLGRDLNGGHILIESTQPLAGFLLYDSSFTGQNNWRGGLSAMPLTGE